MKNKITYERFEEEILSILEDNPGYNKYLDPELENEDFLIINDSNKLAMVVSREIELPQNRVFKIEVKSVQRKSQERKEKSILYFNEEFKADTDYKINILYFIYQKLYNGALVRDVLVRLIEILNADVVDIKSLTGLVGELLFIKASSNKNRAIKTWHSDYNNTYDFSEEGLHIEVKTTLKSKRVHRVSAGQLEKANNVVFCSIKLLITEKGTTLKELVSSISDDPTIELENKKRFTEIFKTVVSKKNIDINFPIYYDISESISSIKYYGKPNVDIKTKNVNIVDYDLDIDFTNIDLADMQQY